MTVKIQIVKVWTLIRIQINLSQLKSQDKIQLDKEDV